MSVKTKMTAIADEIRTLSGTDEAMGLDSMASNINGANTEVDSQAELISQIMTALEGKTAVEDVQLPTLTNEATASDLLAGKQLINSNNEVVTGTMVSIELPALTDEGSASDLLVGKQLINSNKEIVTGTMAVSTVYIGSTEPDASIGVDGDVYIVRSDSA